MFLERWRRAGIAPAWRRIAHTMVRRWQWGARATFGWLSFTRFLGQTVRHWRRLARAKYRAWLMGQMELSKRAQRTTTRQLEEWSARRGVDPAMLDWLCDLLAMRDEQRWRSLP